MCDGYMVDRPGCYTGLEMHGGTGGETKKAIIRNESTINMQGSMVGRDE